MFKRILTRNSAIALAKSGNNVNQRLPPPSSGIVAVRLGELIFILEIHSLRTLSLRDASICLSRGSLNMEGREVVMIVKAARVVCI